MGIKHQRGQHQNIFHPILLSLALNHLDMSTTQSLIKAYLSLERPPIVKKNLQREQSGTDHGFIIVLA
jgi:hypothetical protein